MVRLHTPPYYGGKYRQAKWINSILPENKVYFEPFFGMGNILITRDRANVEIINDINTRLVNWWRVVRDYPKRFGYMVEHTSYSRDEFKWAIKNLDNKNKFKQALALHIALWMSIRSGDDKLGENDFKLSFTSEDGGKRTWYTKEIELLHNRLKRVKIENRDALYLLDKTKDKKDIVIYCDPPYFTSDNRGYTFKEFDKNDLKDLLLAQKGNVAISGQGNEWNKLKWNKHKIDTMISAGFNNNKRRKDCLWTNF